MCTNISTSKFLELWTCTWLTILNYETEKETYSVWSLHYESTILWYTRNCTLLEERDLFQNWFLTMSQRKSERLYKQWFEERKELTFTWSASRPKYLWLSKNLRVGSSVNGLVIMYQCIGVNLAEPAYTRLIRITSQTNCVGTGYRSQYSPSLTDWDAKLWTRKILSAWSWKSDLLDGSPMSVMRIKS